MASRIKGALQLCSQQTRHALNGLQQLRQLLGVRDGEQSGECHGDWQARPAEPV